MDWLYELANEFLDEVSFTYFDRKVFDSVTGTVYFNLWEKGKTKIFPKHEVDKLLQDRFTDYSQISKWVRNKATSIEEISNFLMSYLQKQVAVTDRKIFHKQLNHIKYLIQTNNLYLDRIKQIHNDLYKVILWSLDKDDFFDYEILKNKFIYFAPDQQVRIVRKLFFLKANGQFDLTVEKLNELTRFDLDLYKTNLDFTSDILVDISTDVVIKTLYSYKQNKRFIIESELLTVVLNNLIHDQTRHFKLSNYFEKCEGRQTAEFDWSREGEIKKVKYGYNQYYFSISFPAGEMKRSNNRWGRNEYFSPNPNFEKLKDAVKKLPGARWNPDKKHWGVPYIHKANVIEFAREYRFFLDLEESNYENNIHLANFERKRIPNGISFCEGRLANKPHNIFKKEFWWCAGQPCFSKCETIHKPNEWENYTLLDFCEILGIDTDEINRMGDFIPRGHYYLFIALINRFNRLLDRLYCKDCNHILYPSDFGTSHFAAHTLVRFQCRNIKCLNNKEIYLNHCLNGQCNNVIDSRVSKQCSNGLYICENCGSCCSHSMLERRLSNLKLTGGYIHPELIRCVNEKLGHLERAEYFCYKCRSRMEETSKDVFECSDCHIEYDTSIYNIKRPNKDLRTR